MIEYESTTRPVPGQMGVCTPNTKAYVTSVMPSVPRAQLPLAGVNGWRLLASPGLHLAKCQPYIRAISGGIGIIMFF